MSNRLLRNRSRKRRMRKSGLPPGALVHTGTPSTEPTSIRIFNFDGESVHEQVVSDAVECAAAQDISATTWIDIDGVHQVELVKKLGDAFGIHPLTQEDILNMSQRPKAESFNKYIYIVVQMLRFDEEQMNIASEQVSIVLCKGCVLSFQEHTNGDVWQPIRDRIRNNKGRIRQMGPDYLACALLDTIVDNYFEVIEKLEDRVETLEEQLLEGRDEGVMQAVQHLKREGLFLRHAIWPMRELINVLYKEDSPLIDTNTRIYFKDIYDHVVQAIDFVEGLRDNATTLFEIHSTILNRRLSETMKVLTLFSAVFIPLTFIVGVYGMNFEHIPELHWRWSYPVLWLLMICMGSAMVYFFRRKRWL